jgi:hypothetical protein
MFARLFSTRKRTIFIKPDGAPESVDDGEVDID